MSVVATIIVAAGALVLAVLFAYLPMRLLVAAFARKLGELAFNWRQRSRKTSSLDPHVVTIAEMMMRRKQHQFTEAVTLLSAILLVTLFFAFARGNEASKSVLWWLSGALVVLVVSHALTCFRVTSGYFGNATHELLQLLRFVIFKAEPTDLDDGSGRPRPLRHEKRKAKKATDVITAAET